MICFFLHDRYRSSVTEHSYVLLFSYPFPTTKRAVHQLVVLLYLSMAFFTWAAGFVDTHECSKTKWLILYLLNHYWLVRVLDLLHRLVVNRSVADVFDIVPKVEHRNLNGKRMVSLDISLLLLLKFTVNIHFVLNNTEKMMK